MTALELKNKITRFLLRVALPVLAVLAVAYALLTPPRFTMGDGYLLIPINPAEDVSQISDPGGKLLLGPARIRLWGSYPWVYGTTDDKAHAKFILNLKEHTFQTFPADATDFHTYDDFDAFLGKTGFSLKKTVSWGDLYRKENSGLRKQLRRQLMPPRKR